MRTMKFKYFRNPKEFSYVVDRPTNCSICGDVGIWFDTGGYSGLGEIDCLCDQCLHAGKLIDLEIEANLNFDDGTVEAEIITYKTPTLPTWQDTPWPMINGEFPVFERIASKKDFESKEEFIESFAGDISERGKIEWLWDTMPDKSISCYSDAGDVSVYLFTLDDKKYWVWDAN